MHATEPGRAAVVGSGPNGLTAAAFLARAGWKVDVYEQGPAPGGAARSSEVLGPGTIVDLGAAAHPFGIASPAFVDLDLSGQGLDWAHSKYPMAHPLDGGRAAVLHRDVAGTARGLGRDARAWRMLHSRLTQRIDAQLDNLLAPLTRIPPHPVDLLSFGPPALLPSQVLTSSLFRTQEARALFTGSAVHAIAAPSQPMTSSFGMLFGALGMSRGWPVAKGGSQAIVDALVSALGSHGGRIHTGVTVTDLRQVGANEVDAVVLNLTPRQVLGLKGVELPSRCASRMSHWRYGTASHKIDLLLDGPIPWRHPDVGEATTVHVCGTADEIQMAESQAASGILPERPFVLVCQQQVADPSRSRNPDQHVVWAYAHVPNGLHGPEYMTAVRERVVAQIERFAPGFRDRIIHVVEHSPADLEEWNPNLVGGDVAGGAMRGVQTVLRQPHKLRAGLYLASGSTSPGAGVHGMPGYWAARAVLMDRRRELGGS